MAQASPSFAPPQAEEEEETGSQVAPEVVEETQVAPAWGERTSGGPLVLSFGGKLFHVPPEMRVYDNEEPVEFSTAAAMNKMLNTKSPDEWATTGTTFFPEIDSGEDNVGYKNIILLKGGAGDEAKTAPYVTMFARDAASQDVMIARHIPEKVQQRLADNLLHKGRLLDLSMSQITAWKKEHKGLIKFFEAAKADERIFKATQLQPVVLGLTQVEQKTVTVNVPGEKKTKKKKVNVVDGEEISSLFVKAESKSSGKQGRAADAGDEATAKRQDAPSENGSASTQLALRDPEGATMAMPAGGSYAMEGSSILSDAVVKMMEKRDSEFHVMSQQIVKMNEMLLQKFGDAH